MASTIKVDNLQTQDGDSYNVVSWDTTAKTAAFTAVSGKGYFVNTTSGAITVTLPAGSAGNVIAIADYTNTFQTNAVTITPNGSQKIGGVQGNATLSTEGQSATFVYVDDTEGWKLVNDATSNVVGDTFITATGGTITTSGNYKIHTFTGPGTFTVCSIATNPSNNEVSYAVVAGGGGGGWDRAGGGGGGGFRESKSGVDCYSASPLEGATNITVTATAFPITVGAGGAGGNNSSDPAKPGQDGSNSVFSTVTSAGGGGGGAASPNQDGRPGGSGGGTAGPSTSTGSGNTPPVSPPQGQPGGTSPAPGGGDNGAGGGGATAAGTPGACSVSGAGGAGATTSISASPTAYAGGGGGGASDGGGTNTGGVGGAGGGGAGGDHPGGLGTAGTTNTGGGGGGGSNNPNSSPAGNGGAGGSGIVIIRYKYQ